MFRKRLILIPGSERQELDQIASEEKISRSNLLRILIDEIVEAILTVISEI